jgi:hypothetical protein
MKYSWIFRIVGAIILVIGIAAIGYFAYTAGLAQGQTAVPVAPETGVTAVWHPGWGMRPFHGLAFAPILLCLVPIFLCLFIFLPMRMMFGPHRMHMHMHGRWHSEEGEVPPPVEEWHRRMHETKKQDD